MKLCSIGAQKKKSKYLEAAISAPYFDEIKFRYLSQKFLKQNIEKQVAPIPDKSINTSSRGCYNSNYKA